MRRCRTDLALDVGRVLDAYATSERTGVGVDELLDPARPRPSRRTVLAGGLAAASLTLAGPSVAAGTRVLVVGAGLAGLRAAQLLQRRGADVTVLEGSERAGGRCWSLRDHFGPGVVAEHGGSFVNPEHHHVRRLAAELGLRLYVSNGGSQPPGADTYWLDGAPWPHAAAERDWAVVGRALRAARRSAPDQRFDHHTPAGRRLDHTDAAQWIDRHVPGGLGSRLGRLLSTTLLAEYGLDADQQSALNLVYLLGWNRHLEPLSGGDERYSVEGGNDLLVHGMLRRLRPGTVRYGRRLVALRRELSGVRLTVQHDGARRDLHAGAVVLALPFSTLRDVDLGAAGLPRRTLAAVNGWGLGDDAKLQVGLSSKPWVGQGRSGGAYAGPDGLQTVWDGTVGQTPRDGPGLLVQLAGGRLVRRAWTGAARRDVWSLDPWARGAYTCPRPGRYTRLYGIERIPVGPIHFAGEHTGGDYFGFLEGAVASGERAARAIAG